MRNCINYERRIKHLKIALTVTKWSYRIFFPVSLFFLLSGYLERKFIFTPFIMVYILFGCFLIYKDYVEWKLSKHAESKKCCDLKEKENRTLDI